MPISNLYISRLFTAAVLILLLSSSINAQIVTKKYPSLLWEISGKGLKKPSYLFGTMHVSNKLVFNLPDSFYDAIKRTEVVALENNPEDWQEEMERYDFSNLGMLNGLGNSISYAGNQYLNISDLQFNSFTKKIAWALRSTPNVLNSLLYRSYGMTSNDFEEDTYLDMYIYQIGKKLQKKITGVENFKTSMQMTTEASVDMVMERNKKNRSLSVDEDLNPSNLSEAYRTGNLDWLDTINKVNSRSEAYDEKFLYLRNDIQAASIDSIIASGSSLFVGVGAAHLPGQRGVIEQLRRMGYTLRPMVWGERAGSDKDTIDHIRIPVQFTTQKASDSSYSVKVPGKLYTSNNNTSSWAKQSQYADMGNGSYYVVTRIQTNSALMGLEDKDVFAKIDSVLYENVPGKIISQKRINNNGFQGWDILNKTRRGDMQRYHIFVTPFEILCFKMSGIGSYITEGNEAEIFFNSISLKNAHRTIWQNYTPKEGGFSIDLPGIPVAFLNKNKAVFGIVDSINNAQYFVIRNDIQNYQFLGDDTMDLRMLHESFASSDFIDRTILQKKSYFMVIPHWMSGIKIRIRECIVADIYCKVHIIMR